MDLLFCIFLILASLVCLATLTWVTRDIVLDVLERKKKSEGAPAAVVEVCAAEDPIEEAEEAEEPAPEVEEDEVIPETVVTSILVEHDISAVEVVDVVWGEHIGKNRVYRYAPNGFDVGRGDAVLVPTLVDPKQGEIARKAIVSSEIYKIDPAVLKFRLKPILRVVQKADPSAQ